MLRNNLFLICTFKSQLKYNAIVVLVNVEKADLMHPVTCLRPCEAPKHRGVFVDHESLLLCCNHKVRSWTLLQVARSYTSSSARIHREECRRLGFCQRTQQIVSSSSTWRSRPSCVTSLPNMVSNLCANGAMDSVMPHSSSALDATGGRAPLASFPAQSWWFWQCLSPAGRDTRRLKRLF